MKETQVLNFILLFLRLMLGFLLLKSIDRLCHLVSTFKKFHYCRNLSPFALPVPVSRQISEAAAGAAHSRVVRDVGAEVAPKTRALLAIEDYDEETAAKVSGRDLMCR